MEACVIWCVSSVVVLMINEMPRQLIQQCVYDTISKYGPELNVGFNVVGGVHATIDVFGVIKYKSTQEYQDDPSTHISSECYYHIAYNAIFGHYLFTTPTPVTVVSIA